MKRSLQISSCLIATVLLGGCATTRIVTKYPGRGGVIAIHPKESSEAREKAEAQMRENCGRDFDIIKESEEVVGSKTSTNSSGTVTPTQSKEKSIFGIKYTEHSGGLNASSNSTTTNETEWRLYYRCKKTALQK